MEAKEKAKTALDAAHKNHTEMKRQIAELKTINSDYQRQTEALEKERASLKANYTALSEAEALVEGLLLLLTPTLTALSFFQWKAVAVPRNGSISTPLAISFRSLRTLQLKRTGKTADRTASDAELTWSSSTTQRSRWVHAKRGRFTTPHQLKKNNRYIFFFSQTFVGHTIETMKTGRYFWDNSFWIGLRDTEVEGTWVWINNVTEVEQR